MNKIKKLFNLIIIFIFAFSVNCFADIPSMTELYNELTAKMIANNLFNGSRYSVSSTIRTFMDTEEKLWSDQVPEKFWEVSSGAVTNPTLYKHDNQYYLILKADPYIINYIDEQGQNKTLTIYGIPDSNSYYIKDKIVLMRTGSRAKYNAYYFDDEGMMSEPIRNSNGEAVKFESDGTLSSALTEEDKTINEADEEMGGVTLTTENPAKKKAQQVAARRSACMSALVAITSKDGLNSITYNDSSVASNKVNLKAAYLFADEVTYPFSFFNWPKVVDKKQFYVWVNMENNLTHANWTCTETKIEQPVCNKTSAKHKCKLKMNPKITIKNVTKKCNASAWNPPLYFSFGRAYNISDTAVVGHIAESGSAAPEAQNKGSWTAGGYLVYYPVYWSPTVLNFYEGVTDVDNFAVRHRVICNGEKLIKEVKKFGGDENSEEGEVESNNGVTHNIEDFVDDDERAQEFWDDYVNELIKLPSSERKLYKEVTGIDYMNGIAVKLWSALNTSEQEKVKNYVKENVLVSEDDLDFDWDD